MKRYTITLTQSGVLESLGMIEAVEASPITQFLIVHVDNDNVQKFEKHLEGAPTVLEYAACDVPEGNAKC